MHPCPARVAPLFRGMYQRKDGGFSIYMLKTVGHASAVCSNFSTWTATSAKHPLLTTRLASLHATKWLEILR